MPEENNKVKRLLPSYVVIYYKAKVSKSVILTNKSIEQNKKLRDRPKHVWIQIFTNMAWQSNEEMDFSINNAEGIGFFISSGIIYSYEKS